MWVVDLEPYALTVPTKCLGCRPQNLTLSGPPVPQVFGLYDDGPPVPQVFGLYDDGPPVPQVFGLYDDGRPYYVDESIESFRSFNKEYSHVLWNATDLDIFVEAYHPAVFVHYR